MKQKTLRALVEKTYAEAIVAAENEARHNTAIAIVNALINNCEGKVKVGYINYQLELDGDEIFVSPFCALSGKQFVEHYMFDILLTLKNRHVNTFDLLVEMKPVDKVSIRKHVVDLYQKNDKQRVCISANHKRNSANIRIRLEEEDELPILGGNKYLLEGRNKIGNLYEARRNHIAHEGNEETHHFTRQDKIKCRYKAARKSKRALQDLYFDSIEAELNDYSDSLAAAEWDRYCEENIVEQYFDEEPVSIAQNVEPTIVTVLHKDVPEAKKIGEFYLNPKDISSKITVYLSSPVHDKAEKIRAKLRALCNKSDEELIEIFNALSVFNLD